MKYAYMVRITHSYQDASGVVALWASRASRVVVYEHIGTVTEKIHIHMVIEGSDTHKKQLRNIGMATGLELKGNGYCSFKAFDGNERTFVYMTKGQFDPKFNKGYTEDLFAKWKSLWERKHKKGDAYIYDVVFGDEEYNAQHYEGWLEHHTDGLDIKTGSKEWEKYTLHPRFHWAKEFAHSQAFAMNNSIWNLKTINQYKMLVYTYCYRHGIQIPKDDVFKSF